MAVIISGMIMALLGWYFDVSCICGNPVSATAVCLAVANSGVLVQGMANFGRGLKLQPTAFRQAKELGHKEGIGSSQSDSADDT